MRWRMDVSIYELEVEQGILYVINNYYETF